ncbi:MAG TPA: N-acetylmuramoyl-L-alanine amidase [Thermoanaerobaculia bacterium]|jgi:N-acetyl-anhydromuramyl-L-alanine amidase AmpD|nr:N-acetylmuramoyl-L-alanine amidase [Thermoanaerobaculia bacterium]
MPRIAVCTIITALVFAAAAAAQTEPPQPGGFLHPVKSPEGSKARASAAAIQTALQDASVEFDVPLTLLEAVAYTNSGWVQRSPAGEGDTPPSYGVMGLRDDALFGHSLDEAAALIGRDAEVLRTDARENIRGGAAILARLARNHRGFGENVTVSPYSWAGVLADFSGIPRPDTASLYAETVLSALHDGFEVGGLRIGEGGGSAKTSGLVGASPLATTSCPNVVWKGDNIPTSNYQSNGRSGVAITTIVIHTTEGSAASTLATFQDPSRQASSNYLVNRDGSIWQFVSEANTAYHCGNLSYNRASIGIELEGWADGSPADDFSWQTTAQWNSLEALVNCLRGAYGIPLDRAHLFGHNQVPDAAQPQYWGGISHHFDPGAYWNWDRFMSDMGRTSTPGIVSVSSQCTIVTLPQSGAPTVTQAFSGQRFAAYDTSGSYRLLFLAGLEAAQVSPNLGPGWFHWDGWIPSSCVSTVANGTRLKVTGSAPSTLRVRAGVQSNSTVLGHIGDGKIVAATGNTQTGFDGFTWYEYYLADTASSKTGWSSSAYLAVTGSPQTCTSFSINPTAASPTSASGSSSITITGSPSGCQGGNWSAAGNGSWLSVSPTSGSGSGSVTVSWQQNSSTSPRSANATIAGNTFAVSQAGTSPPPCSSFTITPTSASPSSGGGSTNVAITGSPIGCQGGSWSAAGNGSWLTVSPASGSGPGSVTVSWQQNSSTSSRSANAAVAGQSFAVTQAGTSAPICSSFTLSPASASPSSAAGSSNVAINGSPAGCQGGNWSAAGNGSWLSASPTSGSGSGSVIVSWQQNSAPSSRSGNATIAGQTFTVTQGGTSQSQTELLLDGGFESAASTGNAAPGWNVWPVPGHQLILQGGAFPHGGANYALLAGSDGTNSDIISQNFTIPSNATAANVTFWLNIATQEALGFGAYDYLDAGLYNLDGSFVASLATFTNEDAVFSNNTNGSYFQVGPIDVSAYKGLTLQLAFIGFTDPSFPTTFRIDDVSLQFAAAAADDPPTTSITSPANGATVAGTVTINASAADDVALASLEIDIDGSPRASNSGAASLGYSWNTTQTANGQHTIVSKAVDSAGHTTFSPSVTVTVANAGTLPGPANVAAVATTPAQVQVTWTAVPGAASYWVFRSSNNGAFAYAGTAAVNSFTDNGVAASTAYLYQVRTLDSSNAAGPASSIDLATTMMYTDDPLAGQGTLIKAVHLTELRAAVNAVRAAAGLAPAAFTDSAAPGVLVRAVHVNELRARLDEARSALGLPSLGYANALTSGATLVRGIDMTEIRNGMR